MGKELDNCMLLWMVKTRFRCLNLSVLRRSTVDDQRERSNGKINVSRKQIEAVIEVSLRWRGHDDCYR